MKEWTSAAWPLQLAGVPRRRGSGRRRFLMLGASATAVALAAAASAQTAPIITPPPGSGLARTPGAGVTALPQIDVRAAPNAVDGYVARRSSSATRTDTPIQDIPQSVNVITQQAIRDISMQNLQDALRYVPGGGFAQGEGNRDVPVLRGTASLANLFLDGLRDDAEYYRDLYNIDRVEVLLGPNALSFGRGGAGGVVNRVTRQPDWTTVREVRAEGGAFGQYRGTFDVGQAVNEAIAFRMQGLYERSDSYRDGVRLRRYGINPQAAFRFGDTLVRLSYENTRDERVADRGVPSFRGRPVNTGVSTFFGDPNNSPVTNNLNAANLFAEHRFESNLVLRSQFRFAEYDKAYANVYAFGPATAAGTVPIGGYSLATLRQNIISQTDLLYDVTTGPFRHRLLAGLEYNRQTTDNLRLTTFFPTLGANVTRVNAPLSNPRISLPVAYRPNVREADNYGVVNSIAVYFQDQVQLLPRLELIAGVRYENFNINFRDDLTGNRFNRTDGQVSPRVGLVYKPLDPLSLYVSYATSTLPRAGERLSSLTVSNAALAPETFDNIEVGAKWSVRPDLLLTAAVYQVRSNNTAVADPNDVTRSILVDGTRVRGVEFGATGRITDRWSVLGGLAFQDGQITSNQSRTVPRGNSVPFTPQATYSLWNRYDVLPRQGLGLGLGVIGQSSYFAATDNSVRVPGFTRVDAAVFWDINPRILAQVNFENVTGRKYFPVAHNNNNITPGAPFAVRAALTARF